VRFLILIAALLAGCTGQSDDPGPARSKADLPVPPASDAATPVQVAAVTLDTLLVTVGGPGRTEALREGRLRAPFTGTLVSLEVADGDPVEAGQEVGFLVSRSSEAELEGARAMLDAASTPQAREDASRALELARKNLVRVPLRAPERGLVVSHGANGGDRVGEGDEILTIAGAGSIVFVAQITQGDLGRLRPGQPATVRLAEGSVLAGRVHAVLPATSSRSLSASVRIDLPPESPRETGLFGDATIVVDRRRGVRTVPEEAVLTDDLAGTSRVAMLAEDGTAHWVQVTLGARDRHRVEIRSSEPEAGRRVMVSGLVGLPEGTRVRVEP